MVSPPRRNNKENQRLNVVVIFLIFSQPSVCSVWMMCGRMGQSTVRFNKDKICDLAFSECAFTYFCIYKRSNVLDILKDKDIFKVFI